jgi:hypothetical protein
VEDGKITKEWKGTGDGAVFLGQKMVRILRNYIFGELKLPQEII